MNEAPYVLREEEYKALLAQPEGMRGYLSFQPLEGRLESDAVHPVKLASKLFEETEDRDLFLLKPLFLLEKRIVPYHKREVRELNPDEFITAVEIFRVTHRFLNYFMIFSNSEPILYQICKKNGMTWLESETIEFNRFGNGTPTEITDRCPQ